MFCLHQSEIDWFGLNINLILGDMKMITQGKWKIKKDVPRNSIRTRVVADGELNKGYVIALVYGPDQKANSELIIQAAKTKRDRDALLEVVKAIKIRIAFIGWPSEPLLENKPDWVKECNLIEKVISQAESEV